MGICIIVRKAFIKCLTIFRKQYFKEQTGNDVSTLKILGQIDVVNRNIRIGEKVTFFNGVVLFGDGKIDIGSRTSIGNNTLIYASHRGGVTIGSNVHIAAQSYIIDIDHGIRKGKLISEQEDTSEPIFIGNDVWLGAGVKILKGSVLEDGCIIGAQSVVKGRIPSNAIAVGSPARVIKYRE